MATTIGSLDLASLKNLRDDLTQYFWFESNASATYGAGVHVTLVPDTTFISNPTGQNILMNTDGISIRNGLLPMMTLSNNSLDFNVVNTTAGTYTTTATFTATGAQIGQSSGAHSVIDANGQRFYAIDGNTQLANIGYGSGASASGTDIAPYYDFGIRESGTTKGNYSVAEGYNTTASGYCSHAEGYGASASGKEAHAEGENTEANRPYSHAEGNGTTASGNSAHAEGSGTIASGNSSHAEGNTTKALASYSHAQGFYTVAAKEHQTVIGKYNITDTEPLVTNQKAFIIGNGTATVPSNALSVDWNGNVEAAGEIHGKLSRSENVSITVSTGGLNSSIMRKQGNVVQLCISFIKDTATAAGGNVFVGKINTTGLRPQILTTSGTYYGSYALNGTISADGTIVVRNADSRQLAAMTSNGNISFTYLID